MPLRRATKVAGAVLAATALVVVAPTAMYAQESRLRFDAPPLRLAQPIVTALLQDRAGLMWIGTQGGLVRYDGHAPQLYGGGRARERLLPSSAIRALVEHTDGHLWVATLSGVGIVSPERDRTTPVSSQTHPDLFPLTDAMSALAELPDGRVAVGTDGGGLVILESDASGGRVFVHDPDDPTSLPSNTVDAVATGLDGSLWVATLTGLARLRPDADSFEHVPLPPSSVGGVEPRRLAVDPAGVVWVGGLDGVVRIDPEAGIRRIRLGGFRIQSLFAANADSVWVGTYGNGMYLLDGQGNVRVRSSADPGRPQSLLDDRVSALLQDRTGLLWVGLWGRGVQTVDPRGAAFRFLGADADLVGEEVTSIRRYPSEGAMLLTTYSGGVNVLDETGRLLTSVRAGEALGPQGPAEVLTAMRPAGGPLLVGTMRHGVEVVSRDGTRRSFPPDPDDSLSVPDATVYDIATDAEGRIWVGTALGLRRFDLATGTFHPAAADSVGLPLRNAFVRSIHAADDGTLWVPTLGLGVFALDPTTGRTVRFHTGAFGAMGDDEVASVVTDGGFAWFGTRSAGTLHRASGWQEGSTPRLERVGPTDGVGASVQCVAADARGRIWAATSTQIVTVDPRSLGLTSYGAADGVPAGEFRTASCEVGPDGQVWFGQQTGATLFHPDSLDRPRSGSKTAVTWASFGGAESMAPYETPDRSVRYHEGLVTFRLSVLDFRSPQAQTFAYALDDGDWVPLDDQATVTFANLAPGSYEFRARGRDANGFLADPSDPLAFEILPPFYMTGWFRALILAVGLGTLLGLFQLRTRTMRRHNTELRAQIAERRRVEAQRTVLEEQLRHSQKMEAVGRLTGGIAHDFNNILTVLMGNAELLLESMPDPGKRALVEEIHQSGSVASKLVSQLLVFSRRQPLASARTDVVGLLSRIRPLLDRSLGERVEVEVELPDGQAWVELDANQMESAVLNLAINARDAMPDGGRLTLSLERHGPHRPPPEGIARGDWWILTAEDTGTGIDPDVLDRIFEPFFTTKAVGAGSGLGLSMVYGFVEQSGGHVRVESEPGRGTRFLMWFPAVGAPELAATEA
ncbi:MAG: two-component regulator propeller domain-containing protein [Longimicrobiales bacterium]